MYSCRSICCASIWNKKESHVFRYINFVQNLDSSQEIGCLCRYVVVHVLLQRKTVCNKSENTKSNDLPVKITELKFKQVYYFN